jgi:hypothetical protein
MLIELKKYYNKLNSVTINGLNTVLNKMKDMILLLTFFI